MEKEKVVATTFNMWSRTKTKAKIYIAYQHQQVDSDQTNGPKLSLGELINKAVDSYLKDITIDGE